jgi:hypothetical protein
MGLLSKTQQALGRHLVKKLEHVFTPEVRYPSLFRLYSVSRLPILTGTSDENGC